MCYAVGARPPLPPISGGAGDKSDLVLTAADGNHFLAYAARAAQPSGAGMVILPDVRGLHPFYKELAQRFAEAGVDAVAVDYFGRTAGLGDRGETFDFMAHVRQATPAGIDADAASAIAYLKSPAGGAVRAVFTLGFCYGGANSWRQSASQPGLAGVIGFYGRPAAVRESIPRMRAPLLMLVAGADAATPQEEFFAFDRELTAARVPHRMVVFEGTPHSFFDRSSAQYREASAEGWRQMLDFIHEGVPAR